jgi:hypothetical protein
MAAQLNINTEKIEKIKTQVQNINDTASAQATTIAEIMELLDGKSVPGGGGGVETCTITLASGGPPPPIASDEIIYVDATQTLQKVVHQFGVPYEVVKGSIVVFDGSSFSYPSMSLPAGIKLATIKAYFVTGDVTLTIT